MSNSKTRLLLVQRLWLVVAWAFFVITMAVVFIPFSPLMPGVGLDPSWMLGMNQAVAQGLVFGRDVIFTFGPYSAIYSQSYHPATDQLMLVGSAWLLLGWLLMMWRLSARCGVLLCAIIAVMLLFMKRDDLLFGYCFLASVLVYQRYFAAAEDGRNLFVEGLTLALVLIPLGLLPLIKVSMLPAGLLTILVVGGMLLLRRRWTLLVVAGVVPALAMYGFWWLAGQPLEALPDYLSSTGMVISAYAEAMGVWLNLWKPAVYLLLCTLIGGLILWRGPRHGWQRAALLLIVATYLFFSFKSGFVRQDNYRELGAVGGMLLTLLLLQSLLSSRLVLPLMALTLLGCLQPTGSDWRQYWAFVSAPSVRYIEAYDGISRRLSEPHANADIFAQTLAAIGQAHPLPKMPGTVDIYSYDQAVLLASGNRWAPRPVMQSYAAYAEPLLRRNAQYLTGARAPDHVLFGVQFIDGKYPSLEDGASWPQLLTRYLAYGYRDGRLLMRKRQQPVELLRHPPQVTTHRLGESVPLTSDKAPLLARIQVQPTLLGQLVNLLFKSVPLAIEVTLKDGSQGRYKLVSGMAESEFLLSPLIQSTQEFVYLTGPDAEMLEGSTVASLRIVSELDWLPLWQADYRLELQAIGLPYDSRLMVDERALPVQAQVQGQVNCPGGIDVLQVRPSPHKARLISVSGWVAGNTSIGEAAQELFVQIRGADDQVQVYPAQLLARPDVNQYFHQPQMGPVGYQVKIDVAGLHGDYQLSILRRYQGLLEQCQNITRNLPLNKAPGT